MNWLQAATASVEAIAYFVVAALIVKRGLEGRQPFVRWWRINGIAVSTTPAMVLTILIWPQATNAWFGLWIVSLIIGLIGTAVVTDHLYHVVRGKKVAPELLWSLVTLVSLVAIANFVNAGIADVQIDNGFVVPTYESEPNAAFFALQGAMILPALVLAAILAINARTFEPATRNRSLLVAAAVWLWFVSKALIGGAVATGNVELVLLYRAISLGAAACGLAAYWKPADSSPEGQ